MDNINKLNSQLNKLNEDFKLASSINNFDIQMNIRNGDNVKDLLNKSIEETNILNNKYNSFLTDSSVCVNNNNTYYNTNTQLIPTNTNKYLHTNSINGNSMNSSMNYEDDDVNKRIEELQFKNIHQPQHNEIYNPHNVSYNKINPFENKQHYNRKKMLI